MLLSWKQRSSPLFSFEPKGNEKNWQNIEAFDLQGNTHLLDVYSLPEQPVCIVELDHEESVAAGLQVMRTILSSSDNKQPWVSGKAEVYAIVTAIDPARDKVILDIVDMPYLDYSDTDYSPNQILSHWERYRWQAADIILMGQDDNTNYRILASKLLEIAEQVLKLISDPEVQGFAIIPILTNELIKAMPGDWFTNSDDYLDVFYTLFEDEHYNNYYGTSGNAVITLTPLTIQPR